MLFKIIVVAVVMLAPVSTLPVVGDENAPLLAPFHDMDNNVVLNVNDYIQDQFVVVLKPQLSVVNHQDSFLDGFLKKYPKIQLLQTFDIQEEFQGYSLELPSQEHLVELRANSDIDYVEYNKVCRIAGAQESAPWNLVRVAQRNLPLGTEYPYVDTAGTGVDIYILDTGVRTTHVEFAGRATFGASFNGEPFQEDGNGHGTHVAGIAAGSTFGVAKSANIIAVQVLQANGYGAWSNVIAGLSWTFQNFQATGKKPSVINLSIAGSLSPALNSAVRSLIKKGISVVVAAGNDAVDACTESPASESYAITVGSTSPSDSSSWFSNFGPCVDIYAPGENVLSSYSSSDTATAYMSGTSMASPMVAGVKALYLSAQAMSVFNLDQMLFNSATLNVLNSLPLNTINRLVYSNPPVSPLETGVKTEPEQPFNEEIALVEQKS